MKILLDTNMFIASENITETGRDRHTPAALDFLEAVAVTNHEVWLNRSTRDDLQRDRNDARLAARFDQLRKYKALDRIPYNAAELAARAGYTLPLSSNDEVDLSMLAALEVNAVELVVTQDDRLRAHGARLGYSDRVLSATDATELLESLAAKPVQLPTVEQRVAYAIDRSDPIFESLRQDYGVEFDPWFAKAAKEHRDCLTLEAPTGPLQGIVIFKRETENSHGLGPDVLKICTFKVAEHAMGAKRGELLLHGVFTYARNHKVPVTYVEVFDHHAALVQMLEDFGFDVVAESGKGELVMAKWFVPPASAAHLNGLEFHRRFGPGAVRVDRAFVIPVQPEWHATLFPGRDNVLSLFGPQPSGNALRKAYLCHANTNQLAVGDVVLFYRSTSSEVTTVGVVDAVERLTDPAEVITMVGRRTVYDIGAIEAMCAKGPVLTILFRWDRWVTPSWTLSQLRAAGVLNAAPQSITQVPVPGGLAWVQQRLA